MVRRTTVGVASHREQATRGRGVRTRLRARVLPIGLAIRAREVYPEQLAYLRSAHGSVREPCRRRWSVPILHDAAGSEQGSLGVGAGLGPSPTARVVPQGGPRDLSVGQAS